MAQPIDREMLIAAWRALSGSMEHQGWRSIPIMAHQCHLRAGRHFPGNEEALLVGFSQVAMPGEWPQGHGFTVHMIRAGLAGSDRCWIGLMRQPAGNLDMFTLMTADIASTLGAATSLDEHELFRLFLDRIRAWQNFMRRGQDGLLSPEAEIGLHGELLMLGMLLDIGMTPSQVLEAWCGPLNELHDFNLENSGATGAIEVKTTASEQGFPIKILSLEQLDPTFVHPLYLAGLHLNTDAHGLNLSDRVENIRQRLNTAPASLYTFNMLLLHAGYADAKADRYPRRFIHDRTRLLAVDGDFPSLNRQTVPPAISKVRYEIDLDRIEGGDMVLDNIVLQNK